jgi:hypothetical protein
MESKKNNNKKQKLDKNKSIKDTYDEIIDFVLKDNTEEKVVTKVINLEDFKNKKNRI